MFDYVVVPVVVCVGVYCGARLVEVVMFDCVCVCMCCVYVFVL